MIPLLLTSPAWYYSSKEHQLWSFNLTGSAHPESHSKGITNVVEKSIHIWGLQIIHHMQ
jgi:hypothetical protein